MYITKKNILYKLTVLNRLILPNATAIKKLICKLTSNLNHKATMQRSCGIQTNMKDTADWAQEPIPTPTAPTATFYAAASKRSLNWLVKLTGITTVN
jgi:hypothetical protein